MYSFVFMFCCVVAVVGLRKMWKHWKLHRRGMLYAEAKVTMLQRAEQERKAFEKEVLYFYQRRRT